VASKCRQYATVSVCLSVGRIPTFVSEIGETLMNELHDTDMFSTVDTMDSDQWSASSSPTGEY